MIMVTHEMGGARKVPSELLFLHQGLVEEQGGPEILDNRSKRPPTAVSVQRAEVKRLTMVRIDEAVTHVPCIEPLQPHPNQWINPEHGGLHLV